MRFSAPPRRAAFGTSKEKYGNQKVKVGGIEFDSKREAARYYELKLLERAGVITDLDLQKVFELIPAQFEESGEVYKRGEKKGQPKPGKCIEQSVTYKADFYYKENGKEVVEDVKGYRDPASGSYARYVIKRKLMLYIYGIRIKEI